MQILEKMALQGPELFYNQDFRDVLEQHVDWLKNHASTQRVTVNPEDSYKFERDFYGLLAKMNIKPEYYWVTARVNGYTSSLDFLAEPYILVPSENTVDGIKRMYEASNTQSNSL